MTLKRRLSVLVVEDEPRLRELLVSELPEMGFDAAGARSAEVAEKMLGESAADVVILDLNLPGMDGMELLERLRAKRPGAAVIVVTGYGSLEAAQRAIHHDVVEFLTKPFHLGQIEAAMEKARRRIEAREEAGEAVADAGGEPPFGGRGLQGTSDFGVTLEEVERGAILEALRRNGGNRSAAAAELGISRRTLYNKLDEYQRAGFWSPEE